MATDFSVSIISDAPADFTVFVCISVLMLFWHWLFILSPLLFSETLPFILISSVLRSVTEFRHCLATDNPLSLVGSSKSVWIVLFLPKGLLRWLISTFFTVTSVDCCVEKFCLGRLYSEDKEEEDKLAWLSCPSLLRLSWFFEVATLPFVANGLDDWRLGIFAGFRFSPLCCDFSSSTLNSYNI